MRKHITRFNTYPKIFNYLGYIIGVIVLSVIISLVWQKIETSTTSDEYGLPKAFVKLVDSFKKDDVKEIEEEEDTLDKDNNSIFDIFSDTEKEPSKEVLEEFVDDVPAGVPSVKQAALEDSFSNVLFVGDYFAYNIQNYCFKTSKFAYVSGYDLNYILNRKLLSLNEEHVTLTQYITGYDDAVDKIYITLSAESISWMDETTFKKKFLTFIDEVINNMPEKTVYVMSILPIKEELAVKKEYTVTNKKIDAINEYILSMSYSKGYWYLDVSEQLKDSNGELTVDYTTNGIRLNEYGYDIWKNYILTH